MKNILVAVVLLAMVFISGCLDTAYHERTYTIVNGKPILTSKIDATYRACNIKITDKSITIRIPKKLIIVINGREFIPDPNSFKAESEGVNRILTGGVSDVTAPK